MNTLRNISEYIEYNRALGKRYRAHHYILLSFARSIPGTTLQQISPSDISRFLNHPNNREITIRKKHQVLDRFFRRMITHGQLTSCPMPTIYWSRHMLLRKPYIYSEDELRRMLSATNFVSGGGYHIDEATLRTYILLVYATGMRTSEALNLKLLDRDLHQCLITIRQTKFFKSRLVPLPTSLNSIVSEFIAQRQARRSGEAPLFAKKDGSPLTEAVIQYAFRRLRGLAGIQTKGGSRDQPRLHDLRHSAAVHRVVAWYRSGADLNDLLPKLATFLGHKDLSSTQHYLTMTDELLMEAGRRFEIYARGSHHG